MTYRVGMIGCGRKGSQHARAWNLNPKAEVVAAADTDPENLGLSGFSQVSVSPGRDGDGRNFKYIPVNNLEGSRLWQS